MSTLSESDIHKLFSGAPQYFARQEGHFTGAPHPSVAYPWDEAVEIRDLTDHVQIDDEAWTCVTAWPHITRDRVVHRDSGKSLSTRPRSHFYPRCRERPNMLSMQGLEKGTVGYQAALELAVADALQEEQFGFDSLGAKAKVIVEARQRLLTSKDGLRHVQETRVLDELIKNGERYARIERKEMPENDKLYTELFNFLLYPPTKATEHKDLYSLATQIQALLDVLAVPNVWVDFSRVEWRIRLGQILWATAVEDDVEDGASIQEAESANERHEERYWLLLQILLSCELLIRLDAITEGDELGAGPDSLRPAEVSRFEKDANACVKWSLILARAWLENIEVTKTEQVFEGVVEESKGWLATLTKRMSLSGEAGPVISRPHDPIYAMKGKHGERQVLGLTHFARRLQWPELDDYAAQVTANTRAVTEGTPLNTPLASPLITSDTQRSSYFGGASPSRQLKHQPSRRRKIAAALHPAGWLSKSYVSGLMLPGEGINHFLMSTLLENDKKAMQRLGSMANLCGGFVYSGKSFWSTSCVVGRVLAASKGSSECMGWISTDIIPKDLGDGWINVEAEDVREDALHVNKRARLWGKATIEKESAVLGDAEKLSVFPADFIVPTEDMHKEVPPRNMKIALKSLNMSALADSLLTTPTTEVVPTPYTDVSTVPSIHTYSPSAEFTFKSSDDIDGKTYTYNLTYDVNFVTAHPCVPSQHVRVLKSPSSPTIQQIDVTGAGLAARSSSPVHVTGQSPLLSGKPPRMGLTNLTNRPPAAQIPHLHSHPSFQSGTEARPLPRAAASQRRVSHAQQQDAQGPSRGLYKRVHAALHRGAHWAHRAGSRRPGGYCPRRRGAAAAPTRRDAASPVRQRHGDAGAGVLRGQGLERRHQPPAEGLPRLCDSRGWGVGMENCCPGGLSVRCFVDQRGWGKHIRRTMIFKFKDVRTPSGATG
jgi:hypothetical protein